MNVCFKHGAKIWTLVTFTGKMVKGTTLGHLLSKMGLPALGDGNPGGQSLEQESQCGPFLSLVETPKKTHRGSQATGGPWF